MVTILQQWGLPHCHKQKKIPLHERDTFVENRNKMQQDDLQKLRQAIDSIDSKLLELLQERFEKTNAVADIKKQGNIPVFDPQREKELFQGLRTKAKVLGLPEDVVLAIFEQIVHQSRRMQERRKQE